jgi:hypothetical protein
MKKGLALIIAERAGKGSSPSSDGDDSGANDDTAALGKELKAAIDDGDPADIYAAVSDIVKACMERSKQSDDEGYEH